MIPYQVPLVVSESQAVTLSVTSTEVGIVVRDVVEVDTSQTQEKTVTPGDEPQEVTPDVGYLLSKVTIGAIPENYAKYTWDGSILTIE